MMSILKLLEEAILVMADHMIDFSIKDKLDRLKRQLQNFVQGRVHYTYKIMLQENNHNAFKS